jgi:hypothetical protein
MSNAALSFDTYEQNMPQASYLPRSPRNTDYHKLVAVNYEELERVWDCVYQRMYGSFSMLYTNTSVIIKASPIGRL